MFESGTRTAPRSAMLVKDPTSANDQVGERSRRTSAPDEGETALAMGPPDEPAVLRFFNERVNAHSHNTAFEVYESGFWRAMSYAELRVRAEVLSSWLVEQGLPRGSRVAILSESKPEWGVALFTTLRAGATAVPLDCSLTEDELSHILNDARPAALLASAAYLDKAHKLKARVKGIGHLIVLEDESEPGRFRSYREYKAGGGILDVRERQWDEVAVITYTSGTTGKPKGVMTTFANLTFEVTTLLALLNPDPGTRLVSVLPLNHLLELVCGFLAALYNGSSIAYVNSLFPEDILCATRERSATRMMAVPLFFKLVRRHIEREVSKAPKLRRAFFWLFFNVAASVPSRMVRRRLFAPIHREFGGTLESFMCGGAPLDDDTERFFRRIGLPIYQGYGLTETSPVISMNSERANRPGTVGRPLAGTECRIACDGEILVRGPHVMKGYYGQEELTRETIDDEGWLHTGDLGAIDGDGFLTITGRKKNLVVLGSGKKVQPEEVEASLEGSSLFKELCVVGHARADGHEEVGCVVVPSDEATREHDGGGELRHVLEEEVRRRSKALATYKRPTTILVCRADLPRTTTRKLKRRQVRALAAQFWEGA